MNRAQCLWYGAALLSPLLAVLFVAWWLLGVFLDAAPGAILGVGSAAVLLCYGWAAIASERGLSRYASDDFAYSFSRSRFDVVVVTLLTVALLYATYRRWPRHERRAMVVALSFVAIAFVAVKAAAAGAGADPAAAVAERLLLSASLVALVCMCARSLHIWRPATTEDLDRAEEALVSSGTGHWDTLEPAAPGATGGAPLLTPGSGTRVRYRRFVCAGIGTLEATAASDGDDDGAAAGESLPVLVLVHGFAMGSAVWSLALPYLVRHFHVFSVDWLGCGASDRPTFTAKTPEAAEVFFADALERWRVELGLRRFVLAGHSMGAIISTAYARAYPGAVAHLVLISPAGMQGEPRDSASDEEEDDDDGNCDDVDGDAEAVHAGDRDNVAGAAQQRNPMHVQDGRTHSASDDAGRTDTRPASPSAAAESGEGAGAAMRQRRRRDSTRPDNPASVAARAERRERRERRARFRRHPLIRVFGFLWRRGYTPMSIVRFLGPLGPYLVHLFMRLRSSRFHADAALRRVHRGHALLAEYLYQSWALPYSGEGALAAMLLPGVYARNPITPRLLPPSAASPAPLGVPLTFIYGDSDWMDSAPARRVVRVLARHARSQRRSSAAAQGSAAAPPTQAAGAPTSAYASDEAGGGDSTADAQPMATMHVVSGAGHQLFLENPVEFARIVVERCAGSRL